MILQAEHTRQGYHNRLQWIKIRENDNWLTELSFHSKNSIFRFYYLWTSDAAVVICSLKVMDHGSDGLILY